MIIVVSKSEIREGKLEEYKGIAARLVEETRKEAGCISYDLCQDVDNSNILTFVEKWESMQALDAHMQTPHFTEIVPKLREMRVSSELNKYTQI